MNKSNSVLNLGFFLLLISALCATLVSGVYSMTMPIIDKMQQETIIAGYKEVYPSLDNTVKIDDKIIGMIKNIVAAEKQGEQSGIIYSVASSGYAGDIDMLVAFDIETKKITGVKVLKQTETPGLGANCTKPSFLGQFSGKSSIDDLNVVKKGSEGPLDIQAITASTITTKAVVSGVNEARTHFMKNYVKAGS